MKSKKTSIAKQKMQRELQRKPTLSRELGRVAPVMILVTFLFGWMITAGLANFYRDEAENQLESSREWMVNRWDNATQTQTYGEVDFNDPQVLDNAFNRLNWITDMPSVQLNYNTIGSLFEYYQYFQIACGKIVCQDFSYRTCYNEKGELLADQDPDVYLIVTHEPDENGKKNSEFFLLDKKAFEQVYPGQYNDLVKAGDGRLNMYRDMELRFTDIYIKGRYVLPKKLEVILPEEPENAERETITAAYDFSDYDFSEYTYLAKRKGEDVKMLGPLLIGNVWDNNPHKAYYDSIPEENIQQGIRRALEEGTTFQLAKTNDMFHYSGLCYYRTDRASVVTVTAVNYNFWDAFWPIMLVIYGILLVIGFVITLIRALTLYNRKKLSHEIYHQRREMTNAMAHDLKSPLMAISGYAENIGDGTDSVKSAANARKIREAVKQMDQMIVNILDLAKLEDMNYKLNLENLDLGSLIQERVTIFEEALTTKEMSITLSGNGHVTADKIQMTSLLDNLLTNAIKYGTEKTEIQVLLSDKQLQIRNAFDHTLDQDVSQLTMPFVKGANARGSIGGNGLGLSIVQNIAQTHGFTMKITLPEEQIFQVEILF